MEHSYIFIAYLNKLQYIKEFPSTKLWSFWGFPQFPLLVGETYLPNPGRTDIDEAKMISALHKSKYKSKFNFDLF